MNLSSAKMGLHEWSLQERLLPAERQKMTHVELQQRFKKITIEVELGSTAEQTTAEVQRCLNCDIQTVVRRVKLCIECDACIDICPVDCLTITKNGEEEDLRTRLNAPAEELRSKRCSFLARSSRRAA